ncbi:hypothetical protein [Methanococcus maripaludis]|nr:hypothetical protein [Methanococcus maripaludis]
MEPEILDKITPKQSRIYEGLSLIGNEIASFYLDAILLLNDPKYSTRCNIIAHLGREISTGLMDIFDKDKKIIKHTNEESINYSLNSEYEELAKKWDKYSKKLPKYAHRHGAWKEPRNLEEILGYWNEFENVLYELVGHSYIIRDRIDRLCDYDVPSKNIINTLKNITKEDTLNHYFFNKLTHSQWLNLLTIHGFFNPEFNQKPVINEKGYYYCELWPALIYLKKISEQAESEELIYELLDTINPIVDYSLANNINNYKNNPIIVQIISNIPIGYLNSNHINFINNEIQSNDILSIDTELTNKIIPNLINENNIEIFSQILEKIIDFKILDENSYNIKLNIDEYYLTEILDKIKKELPNSFFENTFKIIINAIKKHPNELFLCSLNTSDFDKYSNYENAIFGILKHILINSDVKLINKLLEISCTEEGIFFKKLTYYLLDVRYDDINEFFWDLENPLLDGFCMPEIYQLLKNNSSKFTRTQLETCIKWVENIDESNNEPLTEAYHKKVWLSALLPSKSALIFKNNAYYNIINPAKLDHPGELVWVSDNVYSGPYSKEYLDKLSDEEIVKLIQKLENENNKYELYNLGFTSFVSENIQKISNNIFKYLELDIKYQVGILNGIFSKIANNKSKPEFNIENVLNYIIQLLTQQNLEGYESKSLNSLFTNILWVLGRIHNNYSEKYDEKILEIMYLLSAQICEKSLDNGTMGYLNITWKFECYQLIISIAFNRYNKLNVLDNDIKDFLSSEIDNNSSWELFQAIGMYYSQFLKIDDFWAYQNFDKIFFDEKFWINSFEGYLYSSKSTKLYGLMVNKGVYSKALTSELDKKLQNELMKQSILYYIRGYDDLDDKNGILCKILSLNWTLDPQSIWRIKTFEEYTDENKQRIKNLWTLLNKKCLEEPTEHNRKILANLAKLLPIFDKLDDEIIKLSILDIPSMESSHTYSLIKELLQYVDDQPSEVGIILNEIVKNENTYSNNPKILELVEKLYINGHNKIADEICHNSGRNGGMILREAYSKYHSN